MGPTPDEIGLLMAGTVAGARGGVVSTTDVGRRRPPASPAAPEPAAAPTAAGPAGTSLRETILVTALAFVSALASARS